MGQRIEIVRWRVEREIRREHDFGGRAILVLAPRDRRRARLDIGFLGGRGRTASLEPRRRALEHLGRRLALRVGLGVRCARLAAARAALVVAALVVAALVVARSAVAALVALIAALAAVAAVVAWLAAALAAVRAAAALIVAALAAVGAWIVAALAAVGAWIVAVRDNVTALIVAALATVGALGAWLVAARTAALVMAARSAAALIATAAATRLAAWLGAAVRSRIAIAALAGFGALERRALITAARLTAAAPSSPGLAWRCVAAWLAGPRRVRAWLAGPRRVRARSIAARLGIAGARAIRHRRAIRARLATARARSQASLGPGSCAAIAAGLRAAGLRGAGLVAPAPAPPALARTRFAGRGARDILARVAPAVRTLVALATRHSFRKRVGNVVARTHDTPTSGRPRSCAINASIASCGFALWIATAVCHDKIACARVPARRATSPWPSLAAA